MVDILHRRGFEGLQVIPSLSPSGLWRCFFLTGSNDNRIIASEWLSRLEASDPAGQVPFTPIELADKFCHDHADFLRDCTLDDKQYADWYSGMLANLGSHELPYAFSDYFRDDKFWQTSEGKKIPAFQGLRG